MEFRWFLSYLSEHGGDGEHGPGCRFVIVTLLEVDTLVTVPLIRLSDINGWYRSTGAQYHWVSEFAPESLQRGLSYLTGYAYAY